MAHTLVCAAHAAPELARSKRVSNRRLGVVMLTVDTARIQPNSATDLARRYYTRSTRDYAGCVIAQSPFARTYSSL